MIPDGGYVYRCDWCGRFYRSPLPDGSACPNHIPEYNARSRASIARHNARIDADRQATEPRADPRKET